MSSKNKSETILIIHGEACMFYPCDECKKRREKSEYLDAKKIVTTYENKYKPKNHGKKTSKKNRKK